MTTLMRRIQFMLRPETQAVHRDVEAVDAFWRSLGITFPRPEIRSAVEHVHKHGANKRKSSIRCHDGSVKGGHS